MNRGALPIEILRPAWPSHLDWGRVVVHLPAGGFLGLDSLDAANRSVKRTTSVHVKDGDRFPAMDAHVELCNPDRPALPLVPHEASAGWVRSNSGRCTARVIYINVDVRFVILGLRIRAIHTLQSGTRTACFVKQHATHTSLPTYYR